ncbi:hypothetical protein JL49_24610, partial [Pseudoalteromonas luteoviolacea]
MHLNQICRQLKAVFSSSNLRKLAIKSKFQQRSRCLSIDQLLKTAFKTLLGDTQGLIHHNDRGGQYLSIKYTERLTEAGIQASVGSVGDSYDNAMAET